MFVQQVSIKVDLEGRLNGRAGGIEARWNALDKKGHAQGNKYSYAQVVLEFDLNIETELECDT